MKRLYTDIVKYRFPLSKKNIIFLSIVAGVYLLLFVYSFRFCYFWDVIRQISKEAFWYYKTDFSASLL
ncbi:MAG: hypothetical protein LBB73_08420, partial [Dysgonamonadaceae bacterium]|nr:hypothetical protein [Dysgonamonadaceae bacterium]